MTWHNGPVQCHGKWNHEVASGALGREPELLPGEMLALLAEAPGGL